MLGLEARLINLIYMSNLDVNLHTVGQCGEFSSGAHVHTLVQNICSFLQRIDLSFLFEDLCFHASTVSAHIPNTLFDVE